MATVFTPVADITPEIMSWNIKVRVIRKWFVPDLSRPNNRFSMELVLVDSKGDRIQASVRKTLIYRFQNNLKEGSVYSMQYFGVAVNGGHYRTSHHKYKINFQFGTNVALLDGGSVPSLLYQFVPIDAITGGGHDTDYLVDVMGFLTGVGTQREYDRLGTMTKMNNISLEADGSKIECTLFGTYVDELNTFLASGDTGNTIVVVQFAKVKCFKDQINIQNGFHYTRLVFNPDFEDAVNLRKRMSKSMQSPSQGLSQLTDAARLTNPRVTMEEDFLHITQRSTIEGLKDFKQECSFMVFGTIKYVLGDEDWWYNACICNKAVYPDEKMFFCEKCDKHVMKVVPRYRIKIRVVDETDSATFVIFDREASALFNKTCVEMFETHEKKNGCGSLPRDISNLVDRSYLFKVDVKEMRNARFEQSFIVKKICTDVSIVEKFTEKWPKSVEMFQDANSMNPCLADAKAALLAHSSAIIAQNLMPKFSGVVVDTQSQTDGEAGLDLSRDSDDLTPKKNDCVSEPTEIIDLSNNSDKSFSVQMPAMKDSLDVKESAAPKTDIAVVEQHPEMSVLLKMFKKKIKVEKE